MTQYTRIATLLTRKRGASALEIIEEAGTVCPHKRMAELKARGWTITRRQVPGKTYGRYFGVPPQCDGLTSDGGAKA